MPKFLITQDLSEDNMPKNMTPEREKLFKAILTLKTPEECDAFFDDVCTIAELDALAQRFLVAELLCRGEKYGDINKETGASTATICRVSRALNYGPGGYRTVIERLGEDSE